jgi:hypothetical protein
MDAVEGPTGLRADRSPVVAKRRLIYAEALCPPKTFTQVSAVRPRARITERLR